MDALQEMFEGMRQAPEVVLPSKYWQDLNANHLDSLNEHGYRNFKRTIVLYYFATVPARRGDYQLAFLRRNLPKSALALAALRTVQAPRHALFTWKQSRTFTFLTYLVWDYVSRIDQTGLMQRLYEPNEGNPPRIMLGRRRISQDIANAVSEYNSMLEGGLRPEETRTILELGGGYGRTAQVVMRALPSRRYIFADIPPALYLAQRYITNQFPERKAFTYRHFSSYAEVEQELAAADIVFLLPHQIALLPDKSVDFFINISSLAEMRRDQVDYYLEQAGRLTAKAAYIKQFKELKNPVDDLLMRPEQWQFPKQWRQEYWRECRIHTPFFESFMQVKA